jgi:hypothetical protein
MAIGLISAVIWFFNHRKPKPSIKNERLVYYIKIEATLEFILLLNLIFYLITK